jgi:hypothetical protein
MITEALTSIKRLVSKLEDWIRHCEQRSDEAIQPALRGKMDCFAEPVIGRASARPVGWQ